MATELLDEQREKLKRERAQIEEIADNFEEENDEDE